MRCRRLSGSCGTAAFLLIAVFVSAAHAESGAMSLDLATLDDLAPGDPVRIAGVPLGESRATLEMTRFTVTAPGATFAVGRDRTLDFDPSRVRLLRGGVAGAHGSYVFLAVTDHGSLGWIDTGSDGAAFAVTGDGATGRLRIAPRVGGAPWPVPKCGLASAVRDEQRAEDPSRDADASRGEMPVEGLRQIEIAVETDYEYFRLFGNSDAAASYLVALYGAVSAIYQRDVNLRVDLVFARLWDDPDDLFNGPSPLSEFRDYWNLHMTGLPRDTAQFFSGRRDLPWGGVAYLRGLCSASGYSVCAYALGRFADPDTPSVFNRDVSVAAHELGHNAGTPHTHDLGIDTCDDEKSAPQRGTIMSYCDQTFTGGTANADMRFHTVVQDIIRSYVTTKVMCVAPDCNGNGIADDADIKAGSSDDANDNGVPDECEDCNGNGTLDDEDIAAGTSPDVDGDGVPDECQPDCNDNGTPDAMDIAGGLSDDVYGNGIPDECEADCGGAPGIDYDEIQADMSLDLNRNAILDACEDCDGDGTTDLAALDQANDIWIAAYDHTTIRSYLARVGTLARVSDEAGLAEPQDLLIDPARRILVTSGLDHRVALFDAAGQALGDLVASGAGGLLLPAGMAWTPSGNLLVASRGTSSILEYQGETGAFVGSVVTPGAGGLIAPFGLAVGPDGNFYVTSDDGRVLKFDPSGAYLGDFVSILDNGGLSEPRGLLFLPSGNLLVASYGTDQVLEYDGATGDFLRQFNEGGTEDRLTLDQPWGLRLGPDGDVYVSRSHLHEEHEEGEREPPWRLHLTNARVYQFDVGTGRLVRAYVLGVDSGIEFPTGFDFLPDSAQIDCNLNLRPDACDLADGFSADANDNGTPDECEACPLDLDGSGAVDFADILVVLARWGDCPTEGACPGDADNDRSVDFADVLVLLANWGPCSG